MYDFLRRREGYRPCVTHTVVQQDARSQGTAVTTAGHSDNNIKCQSLTHTSALVWTSSIFLWKSNMDDVQLFVLCCAWSMT